jgi:hypothetical protein
MSLAPLSSPSGAALNQRDGLGVPARVGASETKSISSTTNQPPVSSAPTENEIGACGPA